MVTGRKGCVQPVGAGVGGLWSAGRGVVSWLQQGNHAQETHHKIQVGESSPPVGEFQYHSSPPVSEYEYHPSPPVSDYEYHPSPPVSEYEYHPSPPVSEYEYHPSPPVSEYHTDHEVD